jgi:hypothetical protein
MGDIDLTKIKKLASDHKDVKDYIDACLADAHENPPYLSTIIAGFTNGGAPVLEALAERYEEDRNDVENQIKWTLQVLCDEWGNPPVPGEKVIRKTLRPLQHSEGKPLTGIEINQMKMDGTYEKKYVKETPYKIDKKGCISCMFEDAVSLLNRFGVHGKSGVPISHHKKSHSAEPAKTPDGQMKHVHYHRYKEVDKEMYKAIPSLVKKEPKKTAESDEKK